MSKLHCNHLLCFSMANKSQTKCKRSECKGFCSSHCSISAKHKADRKLRDPRVKNGPSGTIAGMNEGGKSRRARARELVISRYRLYVVTEMAGGRQFPRLAVREVNTDNRLSRPEGKGCGRSKSLHKFSSCKTSS